MDEKAMFIFEVLRQSTDTMEGKALYILSIVCVLMIVDFLTGSVAAWRNPSIKFRSQEGINGILRKVCSIIVLVACIPIAVLIPGGAGVAALVILYLGYLLMEFASILENLEKLGIPVTPLTTFFKKIECEVSHHNCSEKKEGEQNGHEK